MKNPSKMGLRKPKGQRFKGLTAKTPEGKASSYVKRRSGFIEGRREGSLLVKSAGKRWPMNKGESRTTWEEISGSRGVTRGSITRISRGEKRT